MARKKAPWPPRIYWHRPSNRDRIRWEGRDYYLGEHGSPEAAAEYRRLCVQLAQQSTISPSVEGITVAEVVALWRAEEAPRYDPAGREAQQFAYTVPPLLRLFGTLPAADFGPRQLAAVRDAMAAGSWQTEEERAEAATRGYPAAWSARVVNRRIVRIRTIWRWAEQRELVPAGRWATLGTVPGIRSTDPRAIHHPSTRPATMTEVKTVCRRLHPIGRAMVLLQWWTGCRSGEARQMRAGEVDTTGPVWIYRPGRHKSAHRGQPRAIPIGPRGRAVLAPFLRGLAPGDYVFSPPGRSRSRCYSDSGYAQLVRRAAIQAGLPGWHPYQMRHAAKMRFTRAAGLDTARAVLGQKSVHTTELYGGLDLEAARQAAEKFG